MRLLRKLLIVAAALAVVCVGWLWWNRTAKVDMAAYVPGDSIVYVEANDLPRVLEGLTGTDAWRALAPGDGVKNDYERAVRYSRLAAATGVGPGHWVVLARAQVAVTVLGFEAEAQRGATLRLTPRIALVVETHTGEWRVRGAAEKLVGDFARRSFGQQEPKRSEVDGAHFLTWSDPNKPRRTLVAAVSGSVLVIANDEAAARACLAVRRGERPSLAGNEQLEAMRARLAAGDALAFGFAPAGSAAKIVEVFAPAFVAQMTQDAQMQSAMASFLPQLVSRLVGEVGWSARAAGGSLEDRYFISLPEGLSGRLMGPLAPRADPQFGAAAYLPPETYQFSRYSFADPALAWRGLNAAVSSRVSAFQAAYVSDALAPLLKPYGVEEPDEFFKLAGPELVTASLDETSEGKVMVAYARERAALLARARVALGASPRTEKVGDAEMFVGGEEAEEARAVSLYGDYLITGTADDVRRCLLARVSARTLKDAPDLPAASPGLFDAPPFVTSVQSDRASARAVVDHLAGRRGPHAAATDSVQRPSHPPYSLSQTMLTADGFEKKTRSSFGLLGELLERISHTGEGNAN